MKLLVALLLAVICVALSDAELLTSKEQQLTFYKDQISLTYDHLITEGCQLFNRTRRQESADLTARVDIQRELAEDLMRKLIECRSRKTESVTARIRKPETSTAAHPQPTECQNAVNYTESWRTDHAASNFRPKGPHSRRGYACDLSVASNFWFRFTGEAGHRMLNKCPRLRSCGSYVPHWTDEEMPKVVGVETDLKVYGAGSRNCRYFTRTVKAMRCSWDTDYDIIFKQTTNITGNCYYSFCGMI